MSSPVVIGPAFAAHCSLPAVFLALTSAVNGRVLICDNLRKSAVKVLLFGVVDSPEKENVPFLSVCQWFIALSHKSRPDTYGLVCVSRRGSAANMASKNLVPFACPEPVEGRLCTSSLH